MFRSPRCLPEACMWPWLNVDLNACVCVWTRKRESVSECVMNSSIKCYVIYQKLIVFVTNAAAKMTIKFSFPFCIVIFYQRVENFRRAVNVSRTCYLSWQKCHALPATGISAHSHTLWYIPIEMHDFVLASIRTTSNCWRHWDRDEIVYAKPCFIIWWRRLKGCNSWTGFFSLSSHFLSH